MFCFKKENNANDLEFLSENIDKHNGKIVYTHERSASMLNTISNCLYLNRNTITLASNLLRLDIDNNQLNINYLYILLSKEVLNNRELTYSDLLHKITKEICSFVENSTNENKVWYLDIDISNNFTKFYGLNTDIYTNQLKKDLLGIFNYRTDIFSNTNKKTILNLEYNNFMGENKLEPNNYFKNLLVYKDNIVEFHNSYNILDLINNNFMIEYFFTEEFTKKDNYFVQLIFTLYEILGYKRDYGIKEINNENNNSTYYIPINKEFKYYNYSSFKKFIELIYKK